MLPTTVFLELSVGNLEAAVAVSLLMVAAAVVVLSSCGWPAADAAGREGGDGRDRRRGSEPSAAGAFALDGVTFERPERAATPC